MTTTYINDIVGLAQVLVAGDGTGEVYNLWGLRLLAQDDGETVRVPLTDGLGSVRVEMVDDGIESTTTYDPYGNLLARTGTSGTTYGFTGEQHDDTTGLLYLRARYYNPALRSFMSKDPWAGNPGKPQSTNGWSYVDNNPINLTDPMGLFPDYCRQSSSILQYEKCVRDHYGVGPPNAVRYEWARPVIGEVRGDAQCYEGPVPYRAPGYIEGYTSQAGTSLTYVIGTELVYDFATMERQTFAYDGWAITSLLAGISTGPYVGRAYGFRSWSTINDDYSGSFGFFYVGGSTSLATQGWLGIGAATGILTFWGIPDSSVGGTVWYISLSAGVSVPLDIGGGETRYIPLFTGDEKYVNGARNTPRKVDRSRLESDIRVGLPGADIFDFSLATQLARRLFAIPMARKYAQIYDEIHFDSYK